MKWWHISAILCTYGFFKEFRPSEPFITKYLLLFKNFTMEQINEEMFPVGTYSYLSLLILVFLLTDYLRYKPILLAGSISGILTWSLLTWGMTMAEMQAVEFFYGFFLASEVAYFTYIYAKVDKKHYQKVTSNTRAAILIGKAIAGLSSQLLVSHGINYLQLNYFSIFGIGVTVAVTFFLPSVPQSTYFHRSETPEREISLSSEKAVSGGKTNEPDKIEFTTQQCKTAFSRLYGDFRQAFTNTYVIQWSVWWALATCGYLQAISYCQLLWEDIILSNNATLYNGYIECVYAVSSAVVAFGVGYLKVQWNRWGEIFLGLLTVIQGSLLFYSAYLNNLYLAYVIFVLYRDLYEAAITVASYEVARFISQDSYALIFGINTFAALLAQTILTAVVLGSLRIDIRRQYQIYGGYHFAIGLAFLVCGIFKLILCRKKGHEKNEFLTGSVDNVT